MVVGLQFMRSECVSFPLLTTVASLPPVASTSPPALTGFTFSPSQTVTPRVPDRQVLPIGGALHAFFADLASGVCVKRKSLIFFFWRKSLIFFFLA